MGIVLAVVGLGGHCRLDLSDAECQSLWTFAKVTSRQAKIADVGWRLIISKATAVAVATSWGKQREQL